MNIEICRNRHFAFRVLGFSLPCRCAPRGSSAQAIPTGVLVAVPACYLISTDKFTLVDFY